MILKHKHIYKTQLFKKPFALLSLVDISCGEVTTPVYPALQIPNVVSVDDFIYSDSALTNPIVGGNNVYTISLDGGVTKYSIRIDNFGQVSVSTLCDVVQTQPVNIGFPSPPSNDFGDVCKSDFTLFYFTDGTGVSLQLGDRVYSDVEGFLPVTNLDTGQIFRTQLQGESPDSTLISFDSDGFVVQNLGSC